MEGVEKPQTPQNYLRNYVSFGMANTRCIRHTGMIAGSSASTSVPISDESEAFHPLLLIGADSDALNVTRGPIRGAQLSHGPTGTV